MKLAGEGEINSTGIISSNEMITEKEGCEAMLYMLKAYWKSTGSNDLTDILETVAKRPTKNNYNSLIIILLCCFSV